MTVFAVSADSPGIAGCWARPAAPSTLVPRRVQDRHLGCPSDQSEHLGVQARSRALGAVCASDRGRPGPTAWPRTILRSPHWSRRTSSPERPGGRNRLPSGPRLRVPLRRLSVCLTCASHYQFESHPRPVFGAHGEMRPPTHGPPQSLGCGEAQGPRCRELTRSTESACSRRRSHRRRQDLWADAAGRCPLTVGSRRGPAAPRG